MMPGIDLWSRGLPALSVVLGLVLVLAWVARRGGIPTRLAGPAGERLTVVATRSLDPRTRLVLVRLDQAEFLLAVGSGGVVRLTGGDAAGALQGRPL